MGRSGSCLVSALVFVLLEVCAVRCDITDGTAEHLKREHSLMKPFQGVGSSPSSQWDFSGSTLVTSSYVRLTPDERSKQGSIWNTVPCHLKDWEMHVQFKVHGSGKKNLHGDGIAIWYTKDRLHPGACGTQTEDDRRRQAKDRRSGPTGPGPQNHSEELLRSGNVLPAVSSFFPVRRGWTEFKAPTNSKLTMPQRFRTLRFHTPRHR